MTNKKDLLKEYIKLYKEPESQMCENIISNNTFTDENMEDEPMIKFANYVLQERFLKLCQVNEPFVSGVLGLNANFFAITEADVCNYKYSLR
jgi:hypothetical protein